jgi:hypothetical protein
MRDGRRRGRGHTAGDAALLREVGANLARITVDAYPTAPQARQIQQARLTSRQIATDAKFARRGEGLSPSGFQRLFPGAAQIGFA